MSFHANSSFVLATILLVITGANADTLNVLNFGAAGNGVNDDTKAFVAAWKAACNAGTVQSTLIVPKTKSFLVRQTTFFGPCRTVHMDILLLGTIIAPDGPSDWREADVSTWLAFNGVSRLNIFGPGIIDGHGSGWWAISCRYHPQLKGCGSLAPTALKFQSCNYVNMKLIALRNSPQTHITLLGTNNVDFSWLNIRTPGNSPNTDGIHLQSCTNVSIHNAAIGTGDDCISIGDFTSNINITGLVCGPGHGISIGSLGRGRNEVRVENIHVNVAHFIETTNGVRIKTWQVGKGEARNITFSNLNFTAVQNPIIIDQYYCNVPFSCSKSRTGVHISNVMYHNAFGTSATQLAINLNCSNVVPCTNVVLDTVILASAVPGSKVTASCNYAHGSAFGTVTPTSCLQS